MPHSVGFIEFQKVTKTYDTRTVVEEFSLIIGRRERIVLLGHSGCGKTTVLRLLAGFLAPDAGRIIIEGEPVSADGKILKDPEVRQLGMVFQDLALWPHLTVRGNLEFGLRARGVPRREREDRILRVLHLVQLEERKSARPAELSGGEQQRVALARALVLEPLALLMDEPLSSLNPDLSLRLRQEIVRLQEQLGLALLYVTHSREEAFEIGTRIVVMEQGRVKHVGSSEEIRKYL